MAWDGTERRRDEIDRRLSVLEKTLSNGPYVRKDVLHEMNVRIADDLGRLQSEVAMIRASMAEERKAREDDRRGIRNLVLGALFAAASSLAVSFLVAAASSR